VPFVQVWSVHLLEHVETGTNYELQSANIHHHIPTDVALTQQVAKLDRLLLELRWLHGHARRGCGTHSLGISCRRCGA
jgi:hypothetical protein